MVPTGREGAAPRRRDAPTPLFGPAPRRAVDVSPLAGRVVLAVDGTDRTDWEGVGQLPGVARRSATGMFALGLPKLFGNHFMSRDRSGIGLMAAYDDFVSGVRRFADEVLDPGEEGWIVEAVDEGRPLELATAVYPDAAVVGVDDDLGVAVRSTAPGGGAGYGPVAEPAGLILVVGAPRSGTTWLEQLVLAHPEVGGVDEAETVLFKALSELWENHRGGGSLARVVDPEQLAAALRRLAAGFFSGHLQRTGSGSWFVEKTPVHVRFLPDIAAVWPDAWVLNIVRDGRDVSRSLVEMAYGPDDLRDAAREWSSDVLTADRFGPGVPRFLEIRYEDLLADPVGRVVDIFGWVGLGVDAPALAAIETAAGRRVSQFNTTGPVGSGKWQSLPPADLRTVLTVAGDALVAKGYVGAGEVRRARLRSRADRLLRRARARAGRPPRGAGRFRALWHHDRMPFGRTARPGPSTERMRSYWSGRARENAMWYVDTSLSFDAPETERFWATGRTVVERAVTGAPVRSAGSGLAVEIGSGLGRICAALAEHYDRVVGVDIAPEMVEQAGQHVDDPKVSFVLGEGASLPAVESGSADLVVSFTVFQHIPDTAVIAGYIREAGRVLAPGGVLAFQWNNEPGSLRWALRRRALSFLQATGLRRERRGRNAAEFLGSRVSLRRIRSMLDQAGLDLVAVEDEGSLYAWAWARPRS